MRPPRLEELARRARNRGWHAALDLAEAPLTRAAVTRLGRAHGQLRWLQARLLGPQRGDEDRAQDDR